MRHAFVDIFFVAVQLIRDLGVTNGDESKVGHYVGMLVREIFFLCALFVDPILPSSNLYSF